MKVMNCLINLCTHDYSVCAPSRYVVSVTYFLNQPRGFQMLTVDYGGGGGGGYSCSLRKHFFFNSYPLE